MFPVRLHAKFLLLVVGVLAVFFGALLYAIIQREARLLAEKNIEKQHVLAHAIVGGLRHTMLEGKPRSTVRFMESLRGFSGLVRLAVLRKDGTAAFSDSAGRFDVRNLGQAFATGEEIRFEEQGVPPLNTVLFPLANEPDCRSCHRRAEPVLGVILISLSLEDAIAEIAKSRRDLVVLFLAIIAVTGVTLYAAIRRVVLKPIGILRRGADAVGRGDFSHHIDLPTRDEFSDVANAFNQMTGRLTEMYAGLEGIVQTRTKELDDSFRLLWGIISSMPGGVMLLDMEGRVKLINRYAVQLLGCRQEDVIGQKLTQAAPQCTALVAAAFEKSDTGLFRELEYVAPDGTRVPLGYSSTHYRGAAGGYDGLIVVFRDLSELKALQAELINKERFAAVGRLVAGVAHEVRNPLFGISSIGQIFERELTDPGHRELVQALLSESRRLNQLVEDLLLYSRPLHLRLQPCDLKRLWKEVVDLSRDEAAQKGVRIAPDDEGNFPLISLDPHQMRQVYLNLIRNALDATPPGREIAARFLIADQYATIEIRDEGDGIPAQNLDKVFDLFFTTKPKGTGLGLAICRKIVEDHGGIMSITSAEGKGTTVSVKLPYRGVSESAKSQTPT